MKQHVAKGPMNHFINDFDEAHPGQIGLGQMERLRNSPAYFARKFPDDPAAPVRRRVLAELAGQGVFVPNRSLRAANLSG